MNKQTYLDPRLQNWVEATQETLHEQLKELNPPIKTKFSGEEQRDIRKWLFRVTSKTMDTVSPIEGCGRVVLTEFYPARELTPNMGWGTSIDPVLPIPLIKELVGDSDFVSAFRRLYQTQQDFVSRGGPDSKYGRQMLESAGKIQNSTLNEHLTDEESAYFWDKLFDVCADPMAYLQVSKSRELNSWHYIAIFVVTFVTVIGILSLLS